MQAVLCERSVLSESEAVQRLVSSLSTRTYDPRNRRRLSRYLGELCDAPAEQIECEARVYAEFICVKLAIECSVLEARDPQTRICDEERGQRLKQDCYREFARLYVDELSRGRIAGDALAEVPALPTVEQIVEHIEDYEIVLKTKGLDHLGALFMKRVLRFLNIRRSSFKPSASTFVSIVLASLVVGRYWQTLFHSYELVP